MEALEAVWADIRSRGIPRTICLGDLVGYGPWPHEVIDFIRRNNLPTIRGCWDEGIGLDRGDCGCVFVSKEEEALGHWSYDWTRRRLDDADRAFLKSLPTMLASKINDVRLAAVHGSPRSASEYLTETTHELVLYERAASTAADVLVFGHTHVPFVKRLDGRLQLTVDTSAEGNPPSEDSPRVVSLRPKVLINAGSVGEPRHGSPKSSYVILDALGLDVSICYADYDVKKTVAAMSRFEMPGPFAERLALGSEIAVKDKTVLCAC